MFDGLLGRSAFYTKSKTLIKQARTRIEVVRRKRNATQKFLRKDIADLLAHKLDSTAFARADGLIVELILTSCYEFIDHVCEIVLKHLSLLQKLRDCPEDCREAVASLMFAAARFSDLPELRDVRNIFQERYGSSLEFYVNPKLAENLSAKKPSVENKLQLLQEIALEFSLTWDRKSFEERMSNPGIEKEPNQNLSTPHVAEKKPSPPPAEVTTQRTVRNEPVHRIDRNVAEKNLTPPPDEVTTIQRTVRNEPVHRNTAREVNGTNQHGKNDHLKHNTSRRNKPPPSYHEEPIHKPEDRSNSFQRKELLLEVRDFGKHTSIKGEIQIAPSSSQQKPESPPSVHGINSSPPSNHVKSMKKEQVGVAEGSKPNFRGGIPPPYMKPRNNKQKNDVNGHREENDTFTVNPASNDDNNRAEKLETKAGEPEPEPELQRFTEVYYKNESNVDFPSRRRSHSRRKHSRSSSNQDIVVNGEERVLRRVSTSRRKHESRKGLQIVLANAKDDDHDHDHDDEEEKIIDKLLLHYSKKPPSSSEPGPGRSRRKAPVGGTHVDGTHVDVDSTPTTSRSFSLPPSRQATEPKVEKELTRATSFKPDTPAKHVHPKLPDYDDLAARFAALRAAKD